MTTAFGRVAAKVFNGAAPGANTNILPANIKPSQGASTFRIAATFENATVFNLFVTDGTTPFVLGLNSSVALGSQDAFAFEIPVDEDLEYNFQIETNGGIRQLLVNEVKGGG